MRWKAKLLGVNALGALFSVFPVGIVVVLVSVLSRRVFRFQIVLCTSRFIFCRFRGVLLSLPMINLCLLLRYVVTILVRGTTSFKGKLVNHHLFLCNFVIRRCLHVRGLLLSYLARIVNCHASGRALQWHASFTNECRAIRLNTSKDKHVIAISTRKFPLLGGFSRPLQRYFNNFACRLTTRGVAGD